VRYSKKRNEEADSIIASSVSLIEHVKAAMAAQRATPEVVEHLLSLREGLCLYLGDHDRGEYLEEERKIALIEQEDEATDLLGQLQRDDQTYEHPEIRALRTRSLMARLRIAESETGTLDQSGTPV